ncbi:MAG TPA: HAMP domain-containing sensor histidine kinase [Blastocatellia bacterium]|nr:HAMP domain-containing sensor histidine kinase [Blastocatellia bacterium]
MRRNYSSSLLHYGLAVAAVAPALSAAVFLRPMRGETPFLFFIAAVIISTWYGGLKAGLLATTVAVLASSYFLLPPLYTLDMSDPSDSVHLGLFIIVSLMINSFHHKVRLAQQRAEELARALEDLLVREQQARARAEEATRAKDEFLAMVSHELRTPLSSITGWAQILRRFGKLDEKTFCEALDSIERNAELQLLLIEDLLDMSRITAGKFRLSVEPVDLAKVVEAAIEVVRPAAEAKQIRIDTQVDCRGYVLGDPARLQQVVWNLLSNAVKFTPADKSVTIRLEGDGSRIALTVSDQGVGIAESFLPYVFDRFSQHNGSTNRHGGIGLGLAISRHIAELHGGTIEAASGGEGCGATITVKLPLSNKSKQSPVELAQHADSSGRDA